MWHFMTINRRVFLFAVLLGAALLSGTASANAPVFVNMWGGFGTSSGQFWDPWSVAVAPDGSVFVVDYYNHRIQRFSSEGYYETQWGSNGSGAGQFSFPQGISVSSDTTVYVADNYNHRIQWFTRDGTYLSEWGSYGTGNGYFNRAVDVAAGSSGQVYVVDLENNRIQRFNNFGSYETQWGGYGTGNGQFNTPIGIAAGSGGIVYVTDAGNNRIQYFEADGDYLGQWGASSLAGVGASENGLVYVAGFSDDTVTRFDSYGGFQTVWGSSGVGPGEFSIVRDVAVTGAGLVYVVDEGNHRIQRFFDYAAWVDPATHYLPSSIEFDSDFSLDAGKNLIVPNTTTVNNTWLRLTGGSLSSQSIDLIGGALYYQNGVLNFQNLNAGLLYVANGTPLQISTGMTAHPDDLVVESSGTLLIAGGEALANGHAHTSVGAVVAVVSGRFGAGNSIDNSGEIQLGDQLLARVSATNVINSGVIRGSGRVEASLANLGEVCVAAGEKLRVGPSDIVAHYNAGRIEAIGNLQYGGPAEIEFAGPLTNSGGVATTGLIAARNATLRFNGGLTNPGSLAFSFGTSDVYGDVISTGTISVVGGAEVTFYDDVDGVGGTFVIAKLGNTTSKAVVLGSWNAGFSGEGELYAYGDLRPGHSPAAVSMGGDLFLGPSTNTFIELGGTAPGSQYDQILVTGELVLGGTLDVELISLGTGVFQPQLGDVFEIVSATGGITDSFTTEQLPDLGTLLDMRLIQQPNELFLAVVPALAGDYNANGTVDAADYVIWRNTLGQTGVGLAADGTGPLGTPDGVVNQLDHQFWRAHFGQTASGSGAGATAGSSSSVVDAVPEPTTMWLLMIAGGLLQLRCRFSTPLWDSPTWSESTSGILGTYPKIVR